MKTAEEFFVKHWANWTDDDSGSYETTKTACVKLMQEYSNQQLAEYKEKLKKELRDNFDKLLIDGVIELIDTL